MIKFVNASFELKNYCYYSGLKFILIVFFFSELLLNSQSLYFKNYTAIDGLSSSEVYDITQDTQGYLWFATDRGLTRYDGSKFTRYTTTDGLPDNVVFNFFEQEDGTIWCTTRSHKIFYFKNAKEGFCKYAYNDLISNNISKRAILSNLAVSDDNHLLLAYQNFDGFLQVDAQGNILNYPYSFKSKEKRTNIYKAHKLAPDFIFEDNRDSYKNAALTLKWHLDSLKNNSSYTRTLKFPNHKLNIVSLGNSFSLIHSSGKKTNKVLSSYKKDAIAIMSGKYDEDTFWVGYQYGGVILRDFKGNFKNHFLKNESVTKLYKDHEGGIWIATLNAGVFYCKEPAILHKSFKSYPVSLTKNEEDELYLAFHNGEVIKKDKNQYKLLYKSLRSFPAYVKYDKEYKELYYGDFSKNWELDKNSKLKGYKYIYGISDDENSTKGFEKNSVRVAVNGEFKSINIPERIFDVSTKENAVLIGTLGGMYIYDNDKLQHLKNKSSYYTHRISDIDSKFDNIYVSTMGAGLVIEKKDTIFSINKKSGLLSDICTEVFVEDPYTIWLGTNRGLNRITLYKNNTYDIDKLSINEGLLCSEIFDIEIIDKNIFIASKEGLFKFPKSIFDHIKQQKKWLEIDHVTLGNKRLDFEDYIVIKCPDPDLKIAFKSISFKDEDGAEYRYKINENSEWNYTNNSSVDLPDLAFGNYLFKLQIKTEDGMWRESIQKSIIILAPFWKTWWFNLIIVGVVVLLVFLSFRFRVLTFDKKLAKIIYFAILNKLRYKEEELFVNIKSDGKIIKLVSNEIGYFKSSRNYVEIYTANKRYLIRKKLDDFYHDLPDLVEFTKVHRSYYVRLDKVAEIKGNKELSVFNTTIPVSKTYVDNLKRISA
ncbi:ligand-binding sensor domain-containing protein [Tenacibaculum jejuense]|uniref:HTH LytTR-type domain-containing protein n=1 Tax=Tenacibaculum jejuense TaxID=584609 RepID=A0A238U8U8_9FLAO|nr:LytTR family DNA-binding domain-containing protein [Tenacibaculum jejuense]SNR15416.1 protein of unknown function [Tenacibaculum jejuense]